MTLVQRAQKIKLLILDVDGVLTDGGLYYNSDGQFMKRFNVQDGLGIKLAQAAGLEIAVISGLDWKAVELRVRELDILEYHAGKIEKLSIIRAMLEARSLGLENAAFLGDDWVDATAMRAVGLPMAVANAQPEILELAAWVSQAPGGHGAVREAIRFLLESQGLLDEQWRKWSGQDG